MKLIVSTILLSGLLLNATAQKLYIVPNSGINLSSFGYRSGGKDPSSILTYPKNINISPGMGADIVYEKGKIKHVLSFSSMPFGITFKGKVIRQGTDINSITFIENSFQRQLLVGYQFFMQSQLNKPNAKRPLHFY